MPMNNITWSMVSRLNPNETILDGGPAKSSTLDRRSFDVLESQLGGVAGVRRFSQSTSAGAMLMEADWVVTDRALYYVNFNAGILYHWAWHDIERLVETGSSVFMRRLTVNVASGNVEISVPKVAAKSLLGLARSLVDE